MISVGIDPRQLKEMTDALGEMSRRLPRHMATAINKTSNKVRSEAAKILVTELNAPQKILKKAIRIKSKANQSETRAKIGFWEGYPIPLKYFKAKQTKRDGLTYKTMKGANRRSVIRDAFLVPGHFGGNVVRRVGNDRGPLIVVYGPSPGSVYESTGVVKKSLMIARKELPKQMQRRIREIGLSRSGAIKLRDHVKKSSGK